MNGHRVVRVEPAGVREETVVRALRLLRARHFFGKVTLVFKDGEIVALDRAESMRVEDVEAWVES